MTNVSKLRDILVSSDIRRENESGAIFPSKQAPSDGMNLMRVTIIASMVLASLTVYALSFV